MTNTEVIEKGLELAMRKISVRTSTALTQTAEEIVDRTDVPVWTYNLQDSIGCGTYRDSVLMTTAMNPQQATEPRSGAKEFPLEQRYQTGSERPIWDVDGIDEDKAYWGQDRLFFMLSHPPAPVVANEGWALAYVAAMPYAQVVDARTDILEEELIDPTFLKYIRK